MQRLIVFGASGRMGTHILALAAKDAALKVVGAIESKGHPTLGRAIPDTSVTTTDNLDALKDQAEVLIDFTSPAATLSHLETISQWKKASIVIGTTGFSKDELAKLKSYSKQIPIVFAANMSVGVNLLLKLVRQAAKGLPGYDIEIVETHHNLKKDAPSGTALALANEIADELKRNPDSDYLYGRKGNVGARTPKEIGIHAIRAGDAIGEHTVYFATAGERIELTHRASSREAFASGAVAAAKWLEGKKPGLYSMQDVLA